MALRATVHGHRPTERVVPDRRQSGPPRAASPEATDEL